MAPRRVVSFNLCADQLVVALADPGADRGAFALCRRPGACRSWPRRREHSAGSTGRPKSTHRAAARSGVGRAERPLGDAAHARRAGTARGRGRARHRSRQRAQRQIRDVAALLGHPERGEKLIAALDAARARLAAVRLPGATTALVVERGGYTQGPQSLAATLLAEAGLKSPRRRAHGYGGFIPLEKFLMLQARSRVREGSAARAAGSGRALSSRIRRCRRSIRRSGASRCRRATPCAAGPALVAAFDYLADTLGKISRNPDPLSSGSPCGLAPQDDGLRSSTPSTIAQAHRARRSAPPDRAAGSAET